MRAMTNNAYDIDVVYHVLSDATSSYHVKLNVTY